LILVVSPGEKRARALEAAAARAGVRATFLPWAQVLEDPGCVGRAGRPGERLRIDSPGSDTDTWHALARRGGFTGAVPPGEWRPGRAWFAGLTEGIGAIRAGAPHLVETHPHALAMTDKVGCQARLDAAGVPVPPGFEAPDSMGLLRAELDARGWHRVFVKPRWGSSGAGVLAWERGSGGRERVITTASLHAARLLNDKHLHSYDAPSAIEHLLSTVLADGALVQRWIPKAAAAGGPFDLRVVVLDGKAAHRVGRVGRGPITNLHLDAARADADTLLAAHPGAAERVYAACEAAAAVFPGHRAVGVDVMIDVRGRPWVIECNAWGDLLPGLSWEGRETYEAQLTTIGEEERSLGIHIGEGVQTGTGPRRRGELRPVLLLDLDNTLVDRDAAMVAWLTTLVPAGDVARLLELDRGGYGPKREVLGAISEAAELPPAEVMRRFTYDFPTFIRLRPDADTLLSAWGAPTVLVTNGPSALQRGKIAAARLETRLAAIVVSGEVGVDKPAPGIFHAALARAGVSSDRAHMVGDHPVNDVAGALGAGISATFVRSRWFDPPPGVRVIDTLTELLEGP
jgi:HAD superfamily hydrolase (TIGR01549 family)